MRYAWPVRRVLTDPRPVLETVRQYVAWGAGPRASQNLVLAARAFAAMAGEPTPGCDHVREAAASVMRHRIVVNFAATGSGVTPLDIVNSVVDSVARVALTTGGVTLAGVFSSGVQQGYAWFRRGLPPRGFRQAIFRGRVYL